MILGLEPSQLNNGVETARLQRGLSREELADAVGISPDTVSYIELGSYTPSVQLALRMSRYLEVPIERLFVLPQWDNPRVERKHVQPLPTWLRRSALLANNAGWILAMWIIALPKSNLTFIAAGCGIIFSLASAGVLARRVQGYNGRGLDERESARRDRIFRFTYPMLTSVLATVAIFAGAIFAGTRATLSIKGDSLFWVALCVPRFLDSLIETIRFWPSPPRYDSNTPNAITSSPLQTPQ